MKIKDNRWGDDINPAQMLVLGFLSVILIGTILLMFPFASREGQVTSFIDALFTATSAVCVTGLVVVDTGTYWSEAGQLIILLLIQIGGLGFMTMTTAFAFVAGKRITLKSRIVMQEALNQFSISGVVRLTRNMIIATFVIELIGAVFLSIRYIPIYGFAKGIFFSVFHAVSAFCNAGFDLIGYGRGYTIFVADPIINITTMLLILMGGIGFFVLMDIVHFRQFKRISFHSKIVLSVTGVLLFLGFLVVFVLEFSNPETLGHLTVPQKIMASMFQSITTRTAGFNTLDTSALQTPTLLIFVILMFIGGSPGSTAGGVKTTTFGIVIFNVIAVIKGTKETEIFNRRISREISNKALALVTLGMCVVLLITFLMLITDGELGFIEILFETVSALGTVGLSKGITSDLSNVGRVIITMAMFFGRLGPLTIVIALTRRKKRNGNCGIRLPEGKVLIG